MLSEPRQDTETTFHKDTVQAVRNILESARATRQRLRLHLGNTVTGELWLEEFDVVGYIGRSTGQSKVPLLIHNSRSHGGPAILDHCILGIQDAESKAWLYRARNMKMPNLNIVHTLELENSGVLYAVFKDKEVIARFPDMKEAKNYVDFMLGNRMRVN